MSQFKNMFIYFESAYRGVFVRPKADCFMLPMCNYPAIMSTNHGFIHMVMEQ